MPNIWSHIALDIHPVSNTHVYKSICALHSHILPFPGIYPFLWAGEDMNLGTSESSEGQNYSGVGVDPGLLSHP
jgi:hypothetical protein